MHSSLTRTVGRVAAAVVAALLGLAVIALPAQAASYRYWSYWQGSGSEWAFAQTGPQGTVPKDGAVEGWRFAISDETGMPGAPATAPDFGALCPSTAAAPAGKKRVAVVIEYGLGTDAPAGETPPAPRVACVLAEASATGLQVLSAAGEVRADNGMICGIDGYPAKECSAEVEAVAASGSASPSASASSSATESAKASAAPSAAAAASEEGWLSTSRVGLPGILLGLGIIVVLGLGARWLLSRGR